MSKYKITCTESQKESLLTIIKTGIVARIFNLIPEDIDIDSIDISGNGKHLEDNYEWEIIDK